MVHGNRALQGLRTLLTCVALLVGLLGLPLLRGVAEGPHRAALVVVFGEGQVQMRCVEFAEAQISGTDLLRRSGLAVVLNETRGLGAAVCAIEGVGCQFPTEDCFCQCRGAECRYWTYWRLEGGRWVYSSVGASSRLLGDGDVDAWVWGDGKTPPPPLTFADVCPVPGATPAPLSTPTPHPTATPLPTATPTTAATFISTAGPREAGATAPSATPRGSPTATASAPEVPTPTVPPTPTAISTAPLPEEVAPTATPTLSLAMPLPTVASTDAPEARAPAWGQYLAFAVMAVALVGVLVLARHRKK
ncbi:MAG: hypothetical protein ACUVXH_09690 [Anaerolineae bacterium]